MKSASLLSGPRVVLFFAVIFFHLVMRSTKSTDGKAAAFIVGMTVT